MPGNRFFVYKYVVNDDIIYIGLTNDIVRRVKEHSKESKFAPYIEKAKIYVHECATASEMTALETLLIDIVKPELNVAGKTDVQSSLLISENICNWKPYSEDTYKRHEAKGQGRCLSPITTKKKWPKRKHSKLTIERAKNDRDELNRALNTLKEFPSILSPECDYVKLPWINNDIKTIKREIWDAYDHIPKEMIAGKTEWDVNKEFIETKLSAVPYHYYNTTGVFCLCCGIQRIKNKVYIILNWYAIKEMLLDAGKLLKYYEDILGSESEDEK